MALTLDGSSGYLQFSGALVSTFPCSMVICTSGPNPSGLSIALSQSQSSVDRGIYAAHDSAGTTYAALRNPGNSYSAQQPGAPHLSNSALNILVCVYTSTTSRTVYYGTSTGSSDSTTVLNDLSYHNLITVGALQWNGTAVGSFFQGAVEEAHFFNSALTSGNVTSMMGGTLPETLSGWVDGWTLQTYSGGGTYASIGGSNTLTAHGGVTSSALAHYFTRVSSAISGNVTLDTFVAAGSLGTSPGVITTQPLKNWSGTLLANTNIPYVTFLPVSSPTTVALSLSSQTTNGSGQLVISNAALSHGVAYLMVCSDGVGTNCGAGFYTAT